LQTDSEAVVISKPVRAGKVDRWQVVSQREFINMAQYHKILPITYFMVSIQSSDLQFF